MNSNFIAIIMKKCTFCGEEIRDEEIQCRNCGEWLDIVPISKKKKKSEAESIDWQKKLQKIWENNSVLIIIIIIIAGILFTISLMANFKKSEKKITTIESPGVEVPAAPKSEPAPAPESAPGLETDQASKTISAPGSAQQLFNNAFALCSSGKCTDPKKAIEYLNEAIKSIPDYAQAYNNRGNAYGDLGEYQKAITDYNEAIRIKPDYAQAFNNRGNTYDKLGAYERAIEDLNEAIRIKPDYANALNNKAFIYLNHGNKELGCPDAQKACELGDCKILELAKSRQWCR